MRQQITLTFVLGAEPGHQEIVFDYQPGTSEETLLNRAAIVEWGLLALADRARLEREQLGLPVPPVILEVIQAKTFRDFP